MKKLWNEKNLNIHIFFLLIRSPWLLLLLLNSSGWLVQARKFTVHYLAQGWSVNSPNSNIWENLHWWINVQLLYNRTSILYFLPSYADAKYQSLCFLWLFLGYFWWPYFMFWKLYFGFFVAFHIVSRVINIILSFLCFGWFF